MNRLALLPYVGLLLCAVGGMLVNMVVKPIFKLLGLSVLYLGGSVLLLSVCSFQMSAALFVCGIGVTVLLGSALRDNPVPAQPTKALREKFLFRLLLALISGVLSYTASEMLRYWIPVRVTILFISLWISFMGMVSFSLDDVMLYRCICLQSFCLAFTVFYMYMESSVLVFAFFAAINLLLAFCGSVLSMGRRVEGLKEKTE